MNGSKQQEMGENSICILIIVIIGKDRNDNEMLFCVQIVSRNVSCCVIWIVGRVEVERVFGK